MSFEFIISLSIVIEVVMVFSLLESDQNFYMFATLECMLGN